MEGTTTQKSARREVFNYNRKFKEQLLALKAKLENLQTEFGCSPNFLLIIEDNVTEKVNLRGRDSLTAGRTLCCAEGPLKEQFALGQLAFQPDRMSFIRKGSCMQVDPSFLHHWAEGVSRGTKRKLSEEPSPAALADLLRTELLQPKMELLEPKVELTELGEAGQDLAEEKTRVCVKQEESAVKLEPVDCEESATSGTLIQNDKVMISMGSLLARAAGASNSFNTIDPQLVRNAADARKRDYSVQELVAQAAGGVNFSCGFCEFKTYCSKRLAVHARSIHGYGTKKLVCRECGFSTTVRQDMSQHMTEHKRDLIKCNVDWCNFFTFDSASSLAHAAQHRRQEAEGGPGAITLGFQCPVCPFKSSSKKGIKVHENRIHSKDRQNFGAV